MGKYPKGENGTQNIVLAHHHRRISTHQQFAP
jgi:hypothetical protein